MNKILFFVFLSILMIGTIASQARAIDCPEVPKCPAPPGDCARGQFEVGNKRTFNFDYCHCNASNAVCYINKEVCHQYDPKDEYAPEEDICECVNAGTEFCDYTTWTECCSPGEPEPGTPTPSEEGGEPGTPTNSPTTAPPTVAPVEIRGQIHRDDGASLSGPACTQATSQPLMINGLKLIAPGSLGLYINYSRYSLLAPPGDDYSVTLDLSQQTGYISYACACPPPIDPSYPYLCRYTGVTSPTENLNFYLNIAGIANSSWFRVWGGNLFGRQGVLSRVSTYVPPSGGELIGVESAQQALNMPLAINSQSLGYDTLSKGFSFANTGSVMSATGPQ